jgi:hypothetical protein
MACGILISHKPLFSTQFPSTPGPGKRIRLYLRREQVVSVHLLDGRGLHKRTGGSPQGLVRIQCRLGLEQNVFRRRALEPINPLELRPAGWV